MEINRRVASLKNFDDKVEYEYRVKLKDGRDRVCYGAARLIERGNQETVVQRTIIDITDSKTQYRKTLESVLQAFQFANGETGNIVFIFDSKMLITFGNILRFFN